jgi:hypothetical protein
MADYPTRARLRQAGFLNYGALGEQFISPRSGRIVGVQEALDELEQHERDQDGDQADEAA